MRLEGLVCGLRKREGSAVGLGGGRRIGRGRGGLRDAIRPGKWPANRDRPRVALEARGGRKGFILLSRGRAARFQGDCGVRKFSMGMLEPDTGVSAME